MWCKRSERWWHVQTSSEVLFTSFDHFFLLFFFCFSVVLFFAYLQKLRKKVQKMTKKKEGSKRSRRRRDRRQKQTIAFCLLFRWFLSVEPQPRCEILKICEKIQNAWEDNSKQSPLLLSSPISKFLKRIHTGDKLYFLFKNLKSESDRLCIHTLLYHTKLKYFPN